MQYAQLNQDGTYLKQCEQGIILWDENNYCTADALYKDGKADMFRVVPLHDVAAPDYDPVTQEVLRDGAKLVKGEWYYKWKITNLSSSKIAENIATKDAEFAANARAQRDRLLSASDWTQVIDAPVNQAAWATYRQALRDIPRQSGFPTTVVWPTQP